MAMLDEIIISHQAPNGHTVDLGDVVDNPTPRHGDGALPRCGYQRRK